MMGVADREADAISKAETRKKAMQYLSLLLKADI
jgi:hypothetical protein